MEVKPTESFHSSTDAKMHAIALPLQAALTGTAPALTITCDDNLMSCIHVKGSLDARETWSNGILHNSRYFMFMLTAPKGKRWYESGDKVTVELHAKCHKLAKFRTYTGTPEKVIAKIKEWITGEHPA